MGLGRSALATMMMGGVIRIILPAPLQKLVSEVFFLLFWEGNFVGNLAGTLRDFFGPTKERAQKIRGKFRSIFREKFVAPQNKDVFVPKIALQALPP